MTQKIIIVLLILFSCLTYAQKGDAILILKDGTRINGKGGIYTNSLLLNPKFGNDTLKYKFYNFNEIIGIDILENDYYRQFRYKFKDGKKYPEILEVLTIDSLSLYIRMYVETFVGNNINNEDIFNPHPNTNNPDIPITFHQTHYDRFNNAGNPKYSYYVGYGTNDEVEHLYTIGSLFAKSFKKAIKKYFKDCPQLIEKVDNKEFSKDEVWKVIEFYNQRCIQHSTE